MDPAANPFSPGAGTEPPELAGRDQITTDAEVALGRIRRGRPARSQLLLGLRGVGKTVLLNQIALRAEKHEYLTVVLEAPEDRRLAEMLVPPVRALLFRLSGMERTKAIARRALAVLRAFAGAFKVGAGDVEFGVSAETGTADSGNLESDLPEVLLSVAQAAREAERAVAIFIDELQYLPAEDLSALITSIHKLAQHNLPLILFGAGLPQLAGLAGEAKSYAERLFEFPEVGPLSRKDAMEAIRAPIAREGAEIRDDALVAIANKTQGYPYFLQEWGYHTWNIAQASPITVADVRRASAVVLERLDRGFFRVRLDRLTPREKDYLRAMASLGSGPRRSGEIAQQLSMDVTAAAPLRNGLIKKGMIFSPQHGDTVFTVPLFEDFMLRSMPDWSPPPPGTARRPSMRRRRLRR